MKDKSAQDKTRLNMWLRPEVYKRFKAITMKQGRSMSDVIRQLINEFIAAKGRKDD